MLLCKQTTKILMDNLKNGHQATLEVENQGSINEKKKIIAGHHIFFVHIGSNKEAAISIQLSGAVHQLGRVQCYDVNPNLLYYFTENSNVVQKVFTKPGRHGVWFCQSAINLPNCLPF